MTTRRQCHDQACKKNKTLLFRFTLFFLLFLKRKDTIFVSSSGAPVNARSVRFIFVSYEFIYRYTIYDINIKNRRVYVCTCAKKKTRTYATESCINNIYILFCRLLCFISHWLADWLTGLAGCSLLRACVCG